MKQTTKRFLGIAAACAVLIGAAGGAFARGGYGPGWGGPGGMMGKGFGFGFGGPGLGFGTPGLGPILVWALIILVVIWMVRAFSGKDPGNCRSARQILDERFARGEIDRQEYEEKKKALG